MRWTGDVDRGTWIGPRLAGWAARDSVVPSGFPASARIFHPGIRTRWAGPVGRRGSVRSVQEAIRWSDLAALTGTTAHPWMQWGSIAGRPQQEVDLGDGTSVEPPEDGRLPRPVLETLLPLLADATRTPDDVTAAVWSGWGELRAVTFLEWSEEGRSATGTRAANELGVVPAVSRALDAGPLLQLPGREYLLVAGALTDLADPGWAAAAGLGRGVGDDGVTAPQLLWPADRAWCLATEVDHGFSLLGGSVTLVDRVLRAADLEAMPLEHDGDLSWDGDTINPSPADRA